MGKNLRIDSTEIVGGLVEDVGRVDDAFGGDETSLNRRLRCTIVTICQRLVKEDSRAVPHINPQHLLSSCRGREQNVHVRNNISRSQESIDRTSSVVEEVGRV